MQFLHLLIAAVIVTLFSPLPTYAARDKFQLLEGGNENVCRYVLNKINTANDIESLLFHGPTTIFDDWKSEKGAYFGGKEKFKIPVFYAHYDIDNDGNEEVVLFQSGTYKSHTNVELFVFKNGSIDFSKSPEMSLSVIAETPRVASSVGWPYREHGLYFLMTGPLTYDGTHYLLLMDELFGREGYPDHIFAVATYTGIPKSMPDKSSVGRQTDQLNFVCKIEAVSPILPWNEIQ